MRDLMCDIIIIVRNLQCEKSKPIANVNRSYYIALNMPNEIRFFIGVKYQITTVVIRNIFMRDLICDVHYCA